MKTLPLLLVLLIASSYYPLSAQYTNNNDWSVYFGNTNVEYVEEVATDPSGNVFIAGKTQSKSGIATAGAYQTSFGGGGSDAFIAKFNNGGTLLWSSYFGGSKSEYAYAISADPFGNTYIGGQTSSQTGIASPGSHQQVYGGGNNDCFLAKFDPNGTLLWSTYLGGSGGDGTLALANDSAGNVFLSGFTGSKTGIATTGAYQDKLVGKPMDCFFAKFNSDGQLIFSTYFGANGEDRPHDIHIDHLGNIILCGTTDGASGMATTGAYQDSIGGGEVDAFISRWTPDGTLIWSTYFGGTNIDRGRECFVDLENNIYMTGFTNSDSAIATEGAYQPEIYFDSIQGQAQPMDAFLVKFNTLGERQWATYFGGENDEFGRGLRITSENEILISGATKSKKNIASANAWQTKRKGSFDAFLAQFTLDGSFVAATYYGGSKLEPYDIGYGPSIDIDLFGNVYLTTATTSEDIDALNEFHVNESKTCFDAVLTKFSGVPLRLAGGEIFSAGESRLLIHPNPVQSSCMLTLNLNDNITCEATVKVMNLVGQTVYEQQVAITNGLLQHQIIPDPANEDGLYLVRVIAAGQNYSAQLIYQK